MKVINSHSGSTNAGAVGILGINPTGKIYAANPQICDLLGYSARELKTHTLESLFADTDDAQVQALRGALLTGSALSAPSLVARHKNGHTVPLSVCQSPLFGMRGRTNGAVLLIGAFNLSERRLEELQHSETIVRSCADAILSCDEAGTITSWNPGAEALYGYAANEAIGQSLTMLYPPERANEATQLFAHIRNGGQLRDFDTRRQRKDGSLVEVSITISRFGDTDGLSELARDSQGMKRRMGVLLSWALEDPLTHLANRRALLDRLGVAMRKSERTTCPGALLFIDLDDFKRVNDVNGHAVGDAVLIEVAKRTRALIRDADTVARIGGDEFVVLIDQLEADPAVALAHAKAVAAKLLRRLRQIHVSSAVCSASVGVTLFAGETVTREQLLSRADHAMYQAKSAGKNRVRVLDADTPRIHALAS